MFRFFVNENFDEKIKLNKEDSHHYLNVARIKADEDVEIIADNGYFIGRFLCEKDGFVYIKKIKEINSSNESDVKLCLAFGILKNNNTEEILKYCTEIGVSEFLPLYTKRVVSNIKAKEKIKLKDGKELLNQQQNNQKEM
nr:RsmE family RNA methyltransferase [Peptoniphilus obesi]